MRARNAAVTCAAGLLLASAGCGGNSDAMKAPSTSANATQTRTPLPYQTTYDGETFPDVEAITDALDTTAHACVQVYVFGTIQGLHAESYSSCNIKGTQGSCYFFLYGTHAEAAQDASTLDTESSHKAYAVVVETNFLVLVPNAPALAAVTAVFGTGTVIGAPAQ